MRQSLVRLRLSASTLRVRYRNCCSAFRLASLARWPSALRVGSRRSPTQASPPHAKSHARGLLARRSCKASAEVGRPREIWRGLPEAEKRSNSQIRTKYQHPTNTPSQSPFLVAIRGELVRPYGVGRWFFCTLGLFATGSISLENRVRGIAERVSIARPDFHRPVRWFFAIPTFLLTLLFGKLGEARSLTDPLR